MRDRGALALVLHSHMPYVEGFDTWPFGEEWLWEAVATVYLPLAELLAEGDAPVTLGITPVLADQLEALAGPAGDRLLAFLEEVQSEVHARDGAALEAAGEDQLAAEVRRAAGVYERAAAALAGSGRELLAALGDSSLRGPVELWTSAATHAILPLLATDAGVRLQLATGVASHERRFGRFTGGAWLPECAYAPGLERELADHGVRVTCLDQTGAHGLGAPEQLEPVLTAAGVVAVPIDWGTVQLVWSDTSGYPVHGTYRDYHRRTEHDLRPWCNAGGPYSPREAGALAAEHARDFVGRCIERLDSYAAERGRPGLLCVALDTELLGHWWHEGQIWLGEVLAEAPARGLELVTVSEGVERVGPVEREPAASSWGARKDLSTWDSPRVAELAFAMRDAELRTVAAAAAAPAGPAGARASGGSGRARALARAARELLALQSSDWAFQVSRDLAAEYAVRRSRDHAAAHAAALRALEDAAPAHEPALRNLAPDLQLASLLAP